MLSIITHKFKRIKPGIYVFLYHSVYKNRNIHPSIYEKVGTSVQIFREHIDFFRSRFEIIRASDINKIAQKKSGSIDKPYAVITFDDGFQDSLENGVVELSKYKLPATLFICDRCASGYAGLWRFRLFLLLESHKELAIRFLNNKMNWKGYNELQILSEAKKSFSSNMSAVIDDAWQELRDDKEDIQLFASYDALKKINHDLFEFGSHTISHPVLSRISYEEAKHEIIAGHQAVEQRIGTTIKYFAYPFGGKQHWNQDTERILRKYTDWLVFSAYGGINFVNDNRNIKRIGLLNNSANDILKTLHKQTKLN